MVVDEPSLVAVDTITGEVIAIGLEAQRMYGREARDVTVIAPMLNGVVADFERTKEMLGHFVRKARSGVSHFSRRAIMSVLSGVTQVEQRALLRAAEEAHIGRVCMIEEGLAAALGGGVKIDDSHASAVVDIGGATTNVAVVANGSIVNARAERIGSWSINDAIIDHVRRHRGLVIGDLTAERVKLELGSAIVPEDLAQAHMWFDVAAVRAGRAQFRTFAARERDRVAALMTPEQIAEAQRLVREWDVAHPRAER